MANPWKMTREQLVAWLPNARDLFVANSVVPIPGGVQDDIGAALSAAFTDLDQAVTDLVVAESEYHAAVAAAEGRMADALAVVQGSKFQMKASGCEASVFALVGFDPPVTDPAAYVPNDPADLSAFGYSNGVNSLRWSGNNTAGLVNYVVEVLIGDSVDWVVAGTTRRQRYDHQPVVPGTRYEYRVFARAASQDSNPTGSAVVYG